MFCLIAATAGLGGGNFASSMANINFFYPAAKKGAALGLNAAGGNLGRRLIQFVLPVIVGGAGIFGLVKASDGGVHLERAAWVYAGLAIVATVAAYFFMDNLTTAKASPREQLRVVRNPQTWVMSFLYIGTFGSFIGYSAALPLLIKLNFWVPDPAPLGTGIFFAYYAFLGALVGSLTRPLGGWLADKYGGARVTLGASSAMIVFTLSCSGPLTQLTPNPTADVAIATDNKSWFPWFLGFFLLLFAATGIGNGSTYKMIPAIFRTKARARHRAPAPPSARRRSTGDQAVVRGDRRDRRRRRARRLPDPDRVQLAVGRRPAVGDQGRVRGVHLLLRGVRRGHLAVYLRSRRRSSATSLARARHLTDDPRPTARTARLQCGMTLDEARSPRWRCARGRSSRPTGARCARRAGPPPTCSDTASG